MHALIINYNDEAFLCLSCAFTANRCKWSALVERTNGASFIAMRGVNTTKCLLAGQILQQGA